MSLTSKIIFETISDFEIETKQKRKTISDDIVKKDLNARIDLIHLIFNLRLMFLIRN